MYLEKNKTRALTRFNLEKKKKLISKLLSVSYFIKDESIAIQKKVIGKRTVTPKIRSSFGLGNSRKYEKGKYKITIQERRLKGKVDWLDD